jgi:membrane protein required for colicin V production
MNTFDAAVLAFAALAAAMGFRSGLLRSLATILAYLIAAPIAIALTPRLTALMPDSSAIAPDRTWLVVAVVFVASGVLVGALFRIVVNEFAGNEISPVDRVAGATLGVVRIILVAVLIVVVFDRVIPADRQPPWLVDSRLRPYLSAAGQSGLRSLPPDADAYIDRLKRERGL